MFSVCTKKIVLTKKKEKQPWKRAEFLSGAKVDIIIGCRNSKCEKK